MSLSLPHIGFLSSKGRAHILDGVNKAVSPLMKALSRPFVAPLLAFGLFVTIGTVFILVASDPEAGTPSVHIKLLREEKKHDDHEKLYAQSNAVDANAFVIDASGQFEAASLTDFNAQATGEALITLPNQQEGTTEAQKPAKPTDPLIKAPIAGMSQPSPQGPLPVISPTGMTPSAAYARPYKGGSKPKIALIVGGLGLNAQTTKAAIETLPPEVTLSFVPYAANLQMWIDMARARGHEVMIEIPMQPIDFPMNDPGPQTLMAGAKPEELTTRLQWSLARVSGYFGVINYQGAAFFKDRVATSLFTDTLKQRGIAFIDDGQGRDIKGAWARASVDKVIDNQITSAAIKAQLQALEQQAQSKGAALGNGFAYPVTISVIQYWAQSLNERGLELAPASSMLN